MTKARREGGVSRIVSIKLADAAKNYVFNMRKYMQINTQKIRAGLNLQLQGLFDLAMSIAKGKVKQLRKCGIPSIFQARRIARVYSRGQGTFQH